MNLSLALIAVAAITCSGTAHAQAFGIQIGSNVSKYKTEKGATPTAHYVTPPVPHAQLETYFLTTDPKGMICSVSGWSEASNGIGAREKVKPVFNSLHLSLTMKYGEPFRFPKREEGLAAAIRSATDEPSYVWLAGEDSSLPPEITKIVLRIARLSSGRTYVSVSYSGPDSAECYLRRQEEVDRGL